MSLIFSLHDSALFVVLDSVLTSLPPQTTTDEVTTDMQVTNEKGMYRFGVCLVVCSVI